MLFSPIRTSTAVLANCVSSLIFIAMLVSNTAAAEVDIKIADDEQTARVSVDGELFAVLQRSDRWPKPFIYPVLRPGWSGETFGSGHGIVVADVPVLKESGEATDKTANAATRVAVLKREGDLYSVPDLGGYLRVEDVVPESALVVRTMEDAPMPYARKNRKAYDHKHHRGVWISVDEVNGLKFWNEDGRIRSDKIEAVGKNGFRLTNSWLGADGEPLVAESTLFTFHANHLLTAKVTFANATGQTVTFEDTKEGLFGVRVASEIRESESGKITDAEGRAGEKEVWGLENRWVDYTGTKAGNVIGMTIFDGPKNPRKSRYHVRGYGLFAINPFGQHAYSNNTQPTNHLVLGQGQSETYDYGLWIHGDVGVEAIAEVEKQFAEAVAN